MRSQLFALLATLLSCPVFSADTVLRLYGGWDGRQDVYLGELNTPPDSPDSIWNPSGRFGDPMRDISIWNRHGTYGYDNSTHSPFYRYASHPPVIRDGDGNFYGYLTVNADRRNRATFAIARFIYANHDDISDNARAWAKIAEERLRKDKAWQETPDPID